MGKSYAEIGLALHKSKAAVNTTCWSIRRLTGIQDTRNAEECRQWRRDNQLSLLQKERGPTAKQLEVLHLLAQGMDVGTIATLRAVSKQCVLNQACLGRRRAGIKDNLPSSIRAYLTQREQEIKAMEERVKARFNRPIPPPPPEPVRYADVLPEMQPDPMDDPCF